MNTVKSSTKEKILFVIPRYGIEVHGGGELHCRQIAERLVNDFEVEVATTKALKVDWKNKYRKSEEMLNGVHIRRFKVTRGMMKNIGLIESSLRADLSNPEFGAEWIEGKGPYSQEMVDFLKENHQNYKKIIVFQYLYTSSYHAARVIPSSKLILVPLAHNEPSLFFPAFREMFRKADWIIYNSESERKLCENVHYVKDIKSVVAGVGIEAPDQLDVRKFKDKYNLDKYIVFAGRIGVGKNAHVLIDDFLEFKKSHPSDLKLLLVGKSEFKIPKNEDIVGTGFLNEKEKFEAIAGSEALINPSTYESLSLIVLEAMLMRRPVLVNGYCEVTRNHCEVSGGGLWYRSQLEFDGALSYILGNPSIAEDMGQNGFEYVKKNYDWSEVMRKWLEVLNFQ